MIKRYGWLALVCVIMFGASFAFTPRSDWLGVGLSLGTAVLFVALLTTPSVRRIATERRGASPIAGAALIGVGVCVLIAAMFLYPSVSIELAVGLFSGLLLVGIFLLQLPRIASNIDTVVIAQKEVASVRSAFKRFRPRSEILEGAREIADKPGRLFRVVGPWFVIFICLPLIFLNQNFWRNIIDYNRNAAGLFLGGFLLFIIVESGVLLSASIQWARCIASEVEPAWFRIPGKALWGWSWRLFIYGYIFRRVNVDQWLKVHLPSASGLTISGLDELFLYSIFVLASPFALGLPAIALGRTSVAAGARTKAFGLAGRGYYIGSILILSPYFFTSWLLDIAAKRYMSLQAFYTMFSLIAAFITVIMFTTYVTRVYSKGVSATSPTTDGTTFEAA